MSYLDLLDHGLRIEEGTKPRPYMDTTGHITIGIGRNLTNKPLKPDEIEYLFKNDKADAERDARSLVPTFDDLSDIRKYVVCDLAFNLGQIGLSLFCSDRHSFSLRGCGAADSRRAVGHISYKRRGSRLRDGCRRSSRAICGRTHRGGCHPSGPGEALNSPGDAARRRSVSSERREDRERPVGPATDERDSPSSPLRMTPAAPPSGRYEVSNSVRSQSRSPIPVPTR